MGKSSPGRFFPAACSRGTAERSTAFPGTGFPEGFLHRPRPEERPSFMEGQGVSVANAEPEFMETMLRLAELPGKPNQIPIRTPIIMRELHHLLLIDPQGGALQGLYTRGSRNNQNERAASAALSAGYESVTQFNREYKRMFGEPPHRDISRRRYMA